MSIQPIVASTVQMPSSQLPQSPLPSAAATPTTLPPETIRHLLTSSTAQTPARVLIQKESKETRIIRALLKSTGWQLNRLQNHTLRFTLFYQVMGFTSEITNRSERILSHEILCLLLTYLQKPSTLTEEQKKVAESKIQERQTRSTWNELTIACILIIQQHLHSNTPNPETEKATTDAAKKLSIQFPEKKFEWLKYLPVLLSNFPLFHEPIYKFIEETPIASPMPKPLFEVQSAYSSLLSIFRDILTGIYTSVNQRDTHSLCGHVEKLTSENFEALLLKLKQQAELFHKKNIHLHNAFTSFRCVGIVRNRQAATCAFSEILSKANFLKTHALILRNRLEELETPWNGLVSKSEIVLSLNSGKEACPASQKLLLQATLQFPILRRVKESLGMLKSLTTEFSIQLTSSFARVEADLQNALPKGLDHSPWEFADALEALRQACLLEEEIPFPHQTTSSPQIKKHTSSIESSAEPELPTQLSQLNLTPQPRPFFDPITTFFAQATRKQTPPQELLIHFARAHYPVLNAHLKITLDPSILPHLKARLKKNMDLVSNHLLSASQNMMQLAEALLSGHSEWLEAIISSLFADWHVQIEQYLTLIHNQQSEEECSLHSLTAICESIKKVAPSFFSDIDLALYWYRYLFSNNSHPSSQKPKGLLALETSAKLASGSPCSPTEKTAMISFIFDTYLACYRFLYSEIDKEQVFLLPCMRELVVRVEQMKSTLINTASRPSPTASPIDAFQAKFAPYREKMPTEIAHTLDEFIRHVSRMYATFAMIDHFPQPQFFALHMRRLFNFQWMTEPFYNLRLLIRGQRPIYSHDFMDFEHALSPHATPSPFRKYNVGKSVHYENQWPYPSEAVEDLRDTLLFCQEKALCEEGFQTTTPLLPEKEYKEKLEKHKRAIHLLMNQQIELIERELSTYLMKQ